MSKTRLNIDKQSQNKMDILYYRIDLSIIGDTDFMLADFMLVSILDINKIIDEKQKEVTKLNQNKSVHERFVITYIGFEHEDYEITLKIFRSETNIEYCDRIKKNAEIKVKMKKAVEERKRLKEIEKKNQVIVDKLVKRGKEIVTEPANSYKSKATFLKYMKEQYNHRYPSMMEELRRDPILIIQKAKAKLGRK